MALWVVLSTLSMSMKYLKVHCILNHVCKCTYKLRVWFFKSKIELSFKFFLFLNFCFILENDTKA